MCVFLYINSWSGGPTFEKSKSLCSPYFLSLHLFSFTHSALPCALRGGPGLQQTCGFVPSGFHFCS